MQRKRIFVLAGEVWCSRKLEAEELISTARWSAMPQSAGPAKLHSIRPLSSQNASLRLVGLTNALSLRAVGIDRLQTDLFSTLLTLRAHMVALRPFDAFCTCDGMAQASGKLVRALHQHLLALWPILQVCPVPARVHGH